MSTKSRLTGPIGVFDSGVGGLSVLRELRRALPHERFIFLADQANVPYGGKSPRQLERLCGSAARFLVRRGCKLVVVACNTATVHAIAHLRNTLGVPFVGTVPAVKPACALTGRGIVGVISTPATARSRALGALIREHARGVRVIRRGCPGLEELVERGGVGGPLVHRSLTVHLAPIIRARADVLVLGCTHYPFLAPAIRKLTDARLIDSGRAIARRTAAVLTHAGLRRRTGAQRTDYFTSGQPGRFGAVASELLGERIHARKARL